MRRQTVQNLRLLLVYCTFLVTMIVGYSFLFRYLMLHLEGREFSLIASIYWTITVMTTLGFGDITRAFLRKLEGRNIPYVVVTADHSEAFRLETEGVEVICGTATDAAFLEKTRLKAARHVVANLNDPTSVNLCLTARSLGDEPIPVIVDDPVHADLLRLAGATYAIPLSQILGRYLARRATTCGAMSHVLDSFGSLLIAEVPVYGTSLTGQTLGQARLRERTSISVIGLLKRGVFTAPRPDSVLSQHTLLLLAGTREQLFAVEQLVRVREEEDLVFILGHGRIGCAAATNLGLLRKSGIDRASGLIITTNDDNINIFLTLVSRHVNPHVRIVSRANGEENVDELYVAGAASGHRARGGDGTRPDREPRAGEALQPVIPVIEFRCEPLGFKCLHVLRGGREGISDGNSGAGSRVYNVKLQESRSRAGN